MANIQLRQVLAKQTNWGLFIMFFGLSIPSFFFSCSNSTPTNVTSNQYPPPDTVLNGNIPVYKEFDQLAPIFNQETDITYVINFWATWCKPCVEELPYFETLHDKFGQEKVKVILVSMDFPKKLETLLIPFVEKHQLKSQVVALTDSDHNKWIPLVDEDWGGAIPVTVIYKGSERTFIDEQFDGYEDLEEIVKSYL